jgi:putative spermidine/putrescine transport system ATP-binding protein
LRDELQRQIVRMHSELRMTFIYVTHDQQEALSLSDRVAVLKDGRVEQVDSPSAIYDKPRTLFVAQFLGDSNIFQGLVDQPARVLYGPQHRLRVPHVDVTLHDRHAAVVVRPERLDLNADPRLVPAGHNQVDATVTHIRHIGSQFQIGLRFVDDTEGIAIRLAGTPLATVPGARVTVSWDPQHQAVVPSGDPPSVTDPRILAGTEHDADRTERHQPSGTPHPTEPAPDPAHDLGSKPWHAHATVRPV